MKPTMGNTNKEHNLFPAATRPSLVSVRIPRDPPCKELKVNNLNKMLLFVVKYIEVYVGVNSKGVVNKEVYL